MDRVDSGRAAERYDATRARPESALTTLTEVLASELRRRQPGLEIGVGTGRSASPPRDQGIETAGADVCRAMLRRLVVNAGGDQRG